jgi:hypothetical protein
VATRGRDDPKRLAAIRKLRKRGIGINKIASQLGIGVSVCAACFERQYIN